MSRSKSLSISLRDLRIAKIERKSRFTACGGEFDAYLSALARVAVTDSRVPEALSKALLDCMGREKISGRPASVCSSTWLNSSSGNRQRLDGIPTRIGHICGAWV